MRHRSAYIVLVLLFNHTNRITPKTGNPNGENGLIVDDFHKFSIMLPDVLFRAISRS